MAKMGKTVFPRVIVRDGAGHYFQLPALTSTQRDALTAANGMVIYQSTSGRIESYENGAWVVIGQVYGDSTFLKLAGGTMTGNIAMAGAQTVDGVDISAHAIDFGLHTKVVRKTATETVSNSETLQSDDELLYAMAANEVWLFTLVLRWVSSAVADFKVAFSIPTGASMLWIYGGNAALSYTETKEDFYYGADGTNKISQIQAIVINGATAGNFQFRWAQNTAEVSNAQVLINSCLIATKLS